MKSLLSAGLLMSLVTLDPGSVSGVSQAAGEPPRQEPRQERIEGGRRAFATYCASCHGKEGRGDGPVAPDLKVKPTDLTLLSARHRGTFPQERAYQVIDGRLAVRGHGTAEMPVWGFTFQVLGSDRNQEDEVRERILDLLTYLELIQQR
ncbi:MAG TPA: c-type cytochrome [Rubrobacter sp.]|nr:c-type cytochrome [Rubrobacter sp.]